MTREMNVGQCNVGQCNVGRWLGLVLIATVAAGCANQQITADAPGTTYPSMKLQYTDPHTGRTAYRLTTDAAAELMSHGFSDQSHESSNWSPDSKSICYIKVRKPGCTSPKPEGVYMMDISTGVETFLAPSEATTYHGCIFSGNGREVFYYYKVGEEAYEVRAVNVKTFAVRVLNTLSPCMRPKTITINCDGTYIAVHQWAPDNTPKLKNTAILSTSTGEFHPNWLWENTHKADDGSIWSRTDPKLILARKGETKIYNIDTMATMPSNGRAIAHSAWIPNGKWHLCGNRAATCTLVDITKPAGDNLLARFSEERVTGGAHPFPHPLDADKDMDTRMVIDCGWTDKSENSGLYVITLAQMINEDWRTTPGRMWVSSFSSRTKHDAHAHPHFSPDGKYILWQSDSAATDLGAIPGPVGGESKIDLYMAPYDAP